MKHRQFIVTLFSLPLLVLLSGCFNSSKKMVTNYYVLDYKSGTEKQELRKAEPYTASLEVLDAEVNRTYSRSQLVVKEDFSRVRYLPFDLWANRLSDAIPNIVVQRLRSYGIFRQVDRSTGDIDPDYYLETNVLNLEKIASDKPQAYLRMEFNLRDAKSQKLVDNFKSELYRSLEDESMVYLIQTYNDMIMEVTDAIAARFRLILEGKTPPEPSNTKSKWTGPKIADYDMIETAPEANEGQLLLSLGTRAPEIRYSVEGTDYLSNPVSRDDGVFNEPLTLPAGQYLVRFGEYQDIELPVEIYAKTVAVVAGKWAELVIQAIDQNHNRLRVNYNLLSRQSEGLDFVPYGSGMTLGDDDLVRPDKVWLLQPGEYMIKLGEGPWNDLIDFTTLDLAENDKEVLTLVVDPGGEKNQLLGAGILGEQGPIQDRPVVHQGALHGNISLAGNNNIDPDDPTYSVTLTGQMENTLDLKFSLASLNARSIYDVGLNKSSGSDARISTDAYTLRNILLFTPWQSQNALRNFSFYGRAELQTHFFDENTFFAQDKNVIRVSAEGETLSVATGQDLIRSKVSFFPLRLKEGAGLTYNLVFNPKVSLGFRFGYGWQQEINHRSFSFNHTGSSGIAGDSLSYDFYLENPNYYYDGIESTLVFSAMNIFNFLRVNSTLDVLFPFGGSGQSARLESENRFNLRLFRNISLDLKLNVLYDESQQDWVVYDYGSFLRVSLFY